MSKITLEGIAALLKVEFDPINTRLTAIEETLVEHTQILSQHTAALDELLTDKKNRVNNEAIIAHRFERIEHWAQEVGPKVGVKLQL